MSYVLHVLPDSVDNAKKRFVGSSKDVRGRTQYFLDRGISYLEYRSLNRSDGQCAEHLRSLDLADCGAVVFEYEGYIESLRYLAKAHPRVRRIVRAHNSNLPHNLDNARGRLRMRDGMKAAEEARTALSRLTTDKASSELANVILPICEWEAEHYWSALGGGAHILNTPYFLPGRFFDPPPMMPKRRKLAVCFMGTGAQMTPLLYDAGRNAITLMNADRPGLSEWEFQISGSIKPAGALGDLGRVLPTGLVDDPFVLLQQARVVTILSDLGMGFKTKILEAIEAGCWVLVTPVLRRRLPEEVLAWCKPVRLDDPAGFEAALQECLSSPPAPTPNAAFAAQAYAALDAAFAELDIY